MKRRVHTGGTKGTNFALRSTPPQSTTHSVGRRAPILSRPTSPPHLHPSAPQVGSDLVQGGADPATHLRFLLVGLLLRLTRLGGAVLCIWSRCTMSRRAPSRRMRNSRSASFVSSCSHQAVVVKSLQCFSSAPLRSSSYIAISPRSSLYSSRSSSRVPPSVSM